MKKLLLGIDIGTTGAKAVLIESSGRVIAHHTTEYPLIVLKPNWSEQNPADWWTATIKSIKTVLQKSKVAADNIAGIGLSGQMHGLVLLDKKKEVIRPCILWNDQRTVRECDQINKEIGINRLIKITGKPALPSFTAGKIIWIKKNEPENYRKIHYIILPKDYVRFCLTGSIAMDVADASGTCLFDVEKRIWSAELIKSLKIKKDWLPEIYESPVVCGYITSESARLTGLCTGTPVVAGGGDQSCQAIGTGIYEPGVVSVTIGTSGVVFSAMEKYKYDRSGRLHTYCHATFNMWHIMGVMLSAGGSLRWFRDVFFGEEMVKARKRGFDIYDLMTREAEKIPPGSEGLIFLPYLSGERCPYPDPFARGVFFGLSLKHRRGHMIRSIIEGVSFGLRDIVELLKDFDIRIDRVRISGGGAKSRLWRQIMADVFAVDVVTVNATHGAAYGAALLAGAGTGIYHNVSEACRLTIRETGIVTPTENTMIYDDYYKEYHSLYPLLRKKFREVSVL